MCCCDENPPVVCGSVERKACKPHRCYECRRTIAKGERYEEHSGLWESGWETFRWCAHCAASVKILDRLISDFCFCYGQVWEAVQEGIDYEKTSTIMIALRLHAGARRHWRHRRGANVGRLMPVPAVPSAGNIAVPA